MTDQQPSLHDGGRRGISPPAIQRVQPQEEQEMSKLERLRLSALRQAYEATLETAAPQMKPRFDELRKFGVRGDPVVQHRPTAPTTPLIVFDANGVVLERWSVRIPLGKRGGLNFWCDLLPGLIGRAETLTVH